MKSGHPDTAAPVPVAIVEDHAATRAELAAGIREHADRVRLVATFADAESLLVSPLLRTVVVVLIDLRLPRMTGADLIRRLVEIAPELRSVALTVFEDEASVLSALMSGAHGYLSKNEPLERVIRAVEEAAVGEHPISNRLLGLLVSRVRLSPPPVSLTAREQRLAASLAEGLSYAQCATTMGIGVGTVQTYVKTLYRKLGVSSRAEVRDWLRRYGAAAR